MAIYTFEHWTKFEPRIPSKLFFKEFQNVKDEMVLKANKELEAYSKHFDEDANSFSHELTWETSGKLRQKIYRTERLRNGSEAKSLFRERIYLVEAIDLRD